MALLLGRGGGPTISCLSAPVHERAVISFSQSQKQQDQRFQRREISPPPVSVGGAGGRRLMPGGQSQCRAPVPTCWAPGLSATLSVPSQT